MQQGRWGLISVAMRLLTLCGQTRLDWATVQTLHGKRTGCLRVLRVIYSCAIRLLAWVCAATNCAGRGAEQAVI